MDDKDLDFELSTFRKAERYDDLNTPLNRQQLMLYTLPTELIGVIAELCGPFAIGKLWSCGSHQLNGALASGYGMRSYVIHGSFRNGPTAPTFVYQLRGLKELIIHPANYDLFQLPSNFFFNMIHKTVETISLHTDAFLSCWTKRELLPYLVPKSVPMEFETYFPHLKRLELLCFEYPTCLPPHIRILDTLPRGLTCLSINVSTRLQDYEFVTASAFKFPETLTELTLGIWTHLDLNFLFGLPQLKSLVLPHLRSGSYAPDTSTPLTSLETLEIPELEFIRESSQASGNQASTLHFLSLMPHLTRFNCNLGAQYCSSSFWPQLRHLSLSLYDRPLNELPLMLHTLAVEFAANCSPETLNLSNLPFLTSFTSTTSKMSHEPHRISGDTLRSLPSSLTFLSCEDAETKLEFIPSFVVHLHSHWSYRSIQIDAIPDTLLFVTTEIDRALNMKKIFADWKGPCWASLLSCVETDDVETFKAIWNYDLKTSVPQSTMRAARMACVGQKLKILDYLTSLDQFWQDHPKASNHYSLLNDVPFGEPLDLLFAKGFYIYSDIPSELLTRALRDCSKNHLATLFSNSLKKFSPQHKRQILTMAFLQLNEVCVRWLLAQGYRDIELRELVGVLSQPQTESTRWLELAKPLVQNYVKRDASFAKYLQKSVIMPVDHMNLRLEEFIERQLQELNWIREMGIILPKNTLAIVCKRYQKLSSQTLVLWQRVRIEQVFLPVLRWLAMNGFNLTTRFQTQSKVTTSLEECAHSYSHTSITNLVEAVKTRKDL